MNNSGKIVVRIFRSYLKFAMSEDKPTNSKNKKQSEKVLVLNENDGYNKFDITEQKIEKTGYVNPWLRSLDDWYNIALPSDQGRIAYGHPPVSQKIRRNVRALKKLLSDTKELETQFNKELHALEAKYNELQSPLYDKRAKIIEGYGEEDPVEGKGIPDYWKTALTTAPVLKEAIEEYDEDVLKYLQDIRVTYTDNGYKLIFYFAPNPYFENRFLCVEFKKCFKGHYENSSQFHKCSNISWKSGKTLTLVRSKRKKKNKGKKPSEEWLSRPSFFNLFKSVRAMPSLPYSVQIADYIKDRIITRSVLYYTGECIESPYEQFFKDELQCFISTLIRL